MSMSFEIVKLPSKNSVIIKIGMHHQCMMPPISSQP